MNVFVPHDWIPRGLGHRPTGRQFAAHRLVTAADAFDLPEAKPEAYVELPRGDQGRAGTCDPYSLSKCVASYYQAIGAPVVYPSIRALYRRICEVQGVIADLGSDPVIALDVLAEYGFPTEQEWAYSDGPTLLDAIPADVAVSAWDNRDGDRADYAVLAGRSDADLDFVKRLVTSGRLVQVCVLVDGAFERGQFDPTKPIDFGANGAGHAMTISGYKPGPNGSTLLRWDNQWSDDFGDLGRFWTTDKSFRSASCVAYVKRAPVLPARMAA